MIGTVPKPRTAVLRAVRDPLTQELLDHALALYFPAPKSETGEDVAEFQLHGGPAVVTGVLQALSKLEQCRQAEPGEFARRAFENGKLDLAQVEGLADLIAAETETQRAFALAQAGGDLSQLYDDWRDQLISIIARVETAIDFSDESDIGDNVADLALADAEDLCDRIAAHLADGRRGEIARDGYRVALLGPPNAGKSSLLNAIARRDVAIVSPEPGTTRDVIEVRLNLAGCAVVLSDTAGLRASTISVEREGIRRSHAAAEAANLVIWLDLLSDSTEPPNEISRETLIRVVSKSDLSKNPAQGYAVSSVTGQGIGELISEIARRAQLATRGDGVALTRQRHRDLLTTVVAALRESVSEHRPELELGAENLRQAATALGRITGRVDVEDVLDKLFSQFCIGK